MTLTVHNTSAKPLVWESDGFHQTIPPQSSVRCDVAPQDTLRVLLRHAENSWQGKKRRFAVSAFHLALAAEYTLEDLREGDEIFVTRELDSAKVTVLFDCFLLRCNRSVRIRRFFVPDAAEVKKIHRAMRRSELFLNCGILSMVFHPINTGLLSAIGLFLWHQFNWRVFALYMLCAWLCFAVIPNLLGELFDTPFSRLYDKLLSGLFRTERLHFYSIADCLDEAKIMRYYTSAARKRLAVGEFSKKPKE